MLYSQVYVVVPLTTGNEITSVVCKRVPSLEKNPTLLEMNHIFIDEKVLTVDEVVANLSNTFATGYVVCCPVDTDVISQAEFEEHNWTTDQTITSIVVELYNMNEDEEESEDEDEDEEEEDEDETQGVIQHGEIIARLSQAI